MMDLSQYKEIKPHRVKMIIWRIVNASVFRILVGRSNRVIRNVILRLFGAKVPLKISIYPTCKIYAPWNLEVGEKSCIGPHTEIYNKNKIIIGENTVISQGAFLCTASHDYTNASFTLVTKPIVVEDCAWVAADAFVGPGVKIGKGAIVGARSAVFNNVEPWTIVGGNPAKFIKKRIITNN